MKPTGKTNLRMKAARALQGDMTQAELAEKCGVNTATILYIEKGTKVPSVTLARKIADALGTTIDKLFS